MEFIVFIIPIVLLISIIIAFVEKAKDESAENDFNEHLNKMNFDALKKNIFKNKYGIYVLFAFNKNNSEVEVAKRDYGVTSEIEKIKFEYNMLFSNLDFLESSDIQRVTFLINQDSRKILFIGYNDSIEKYVINWSDILSVELMVENKSTTKHSTSSTIGRTIVGGVIGGGVGAIIGGTTGSTETINVEDCFGIRINTRLLNMPYIEMRIKDYFKDKDFQYKSKVEKEIRQIYSIFSIIIDSENKS